MKIYLNPTGVKSFMIGLLISFMSIGTLLADALPIDQAQMLADWKRAKEYTKEYLDAMPEDGINFKPTPEIRSFAEQMLHIANANYAFGAGASGKANPNEGKDLEKMNDFKTKASLTKVVMDSYDYVINALQGTNNSQLSDKVKIFNMDLERGLAYEKAFEHQTHHRGQCTIYLRLKGVKPPQEKLF
ncbi:DinB family protein [Rubrolithibacter danxiaensis]|uniref:DinB family protein n=1 Tax=Rubrolithibacter danxiaensis TaxID=3390805 RepID=UPI003BF88B28